MVLCNDLGVFRQVTSGQLSTRVSVHFWTSWSAKDQGPKGHPSKSMYVRMTDPSMETSLKEKLTKSA